jgi:hypothetical protein
MKKLLIIAFAVASLATAFTSCKKDVSEEELLKNQLAQADSLLKRGGVIKYTVKVVSTANSSMLKSKMSIENASVTVYQNDKVFTGQTDAMGFVTFDNMRVGTVAVNVTLKDHAEVDYVADITPQEQLSNLSQSQVVNTIRYASTMVPMFPIADPGAATITGKVTAELDLTNTTPEPAPGVKVTATVDVDDPDFVSRYIAPTLSSGTPSAGRILKYAFSDASITSITAADGTYTLKVPASVNGLPIKISIADYQVTQKLYLENDPADGTFKPGEYTVPVLFTSNVEPSPIPEIKPVYLKIEEPTAPFGVIYNKAKLSLEVDANGAITKVNVIEKGKYSAKPAVICEEYGNGAKLDAIFNETTGEIEGIIIINPGTNYQLNSSVMIILKSIIYKPTIILQINQEGRIQSTTIADKGIGYIKKPSYEILSPNSKAIKPQIELLYDWYTTSIYKVNILKEGSNFSNIFNSPKTRDFFENDTQIANICSGQQAVLNFYLGTGKR